MTQYYWHFAKVDEDGMPRLGYDDGREICVGETLTVDCEPIICEQGLHASEHIIDALKYAEGNCITKVILGGTVINDADKSVATERTVIAMLDEQAGEKVLQGWARWCALQVIEIWDAPDVVRKYLKTGKEKLRTTALAAARDVAWDAMWTAARATTWDATWAATRDVLNEKLTEMVETAIAGQKATL